MVISFLVLFPGTYDESYPSTGCHRYVCKSVFPAELKMTPSNSNNSRCSLPCKEIFPLALITRCHGKLYFLLMECKIHDTCLAPRGLPATSAIWPYVITLPSGIP